MTATLRRHVAMETASSDVEVSSTVAVANGGVCGCWRAEASAPCPQATTPAHQIRQSRCSVRRHTNGGLGIVVTDGRSNTGAWGLNVWAVTSEWDVRDGADGREETVESALRRAHRRGDARLKRWTMTACIENGDNATWWERGALS